MTEFDFAEIFNTVTPEDFEDKVKRTRPDWRVLSYLQLMVDELRNNLSGLSPSQLEDRTGLSRSQLTYAHKRYKEKYAKQFGEVITYSARHNVYKLALNWEEALQYLRTHLVKYLVQLGHDYFSIIEVATVKFGDSRDAKQLRAFVKMLVSNLETMVELLETN